MPQSLQDCVMQLIDNFHTIDSFKDPGTMVKLETSVSRKSGSFKFRTQSNS